MALTKSLKEIIAEDETGLLSKHETWGRVCLRDIADVLNGFPFESRMFHPSIGTPLIRIRDVLTGETDTFYNGDFESQFLVNPGELLIGMDGDFNSARWRSKPALLNQRVCKITPDERFYSGRLLEFALPGYLAAINAATSSVTVKHLSSKSIEEIELPLPPLAEQTRIVEKLEELLSDLDAGVAELKAAQKKLAQYRQSLLKAAVEGALTAEWRSSQAAASVESGAELLARILRERRARWEARQLAKFKEQGKIPPKNWQAKYPEPVAPDITGLPPLPQGWVWASVDQCVVDESAITDGPFGSNLKSSHYQDSGPRVIRLQNIGDGVFVDARAHISESHYLELMKHSVREDDLIVAMLGEILPRACMIPRGVSPAIVKADCARVRLNTELLRPTILLAQLNSKSIRDHVARFVKGIGRPRINLGHVRSIPVALCSTDEQSQIDAALSDAQRAIDEQLASIERGLRQVAAQRKNIFKSAFSGRLVLQNPIDEPVSVLLERIRTERTARTEKLTQRRRATKTK